MPETSQQPPDRVTVLYEMIDKQGVAIAAARRARDLTPQERGIRIRRAQDTILVCREELRALRLARAEVTDSLNLPDRIEASLVRMVESHRVADDGAPELHRKLVNHITAAEAHAWLQKEHPKQAHILYLSLTGWKQVAIARRLGVRQQTISDHLKRAKAKLATRIHAE